MTKNIIIQFALVVAIHNNACTGEYVPNSAISSSPGVHTSSCCTRWSSSHGCDARVFGGLKLSRKRTLTLSPRHNAESRATNRALAVAGIEWEETLSSEEVRWGVWGRLMKEACGEETGSEASLGLTGCVVFFETFPHHTDPCIPCRQYR